MNMQVSSAVHRGFCAVCAHAKMLACSLKLQVHVFTVHSLYLCRKFSGISCSESVIVAHSVIFLQEHERTFMHVPCTATPLSSIAVNFCADRLLYSTWVALYRPAAPPVSPTLIRTCCARVLTAVRAIEKARRVVFR